MFFFNTHKLDGDDSLQIKKNRTLFTYYKSIKKKIINIKNEWAEYCHALANIFVVWIIQSEANC